MITSFAMDFRQRCRNGILLLFACFALAGMLGETALAQAREPHANPVAGAPAPIDKGALLIHGNYCGLGNRAGRPPIDALDAACMHHDACMPAKGLVSCGCMARLQQEAEAVARDPAQPADVQILASTTAATAALALCEGSR